MRLKWSKYLGLLAGCWLLATVGLAQIPVRGTFHLGGDWSDKETIRLSIFRAGEAGRGGPVIEWFLVPDRSERRGFILNAGSGASSFNQTSLSFEDTLDSAGDYLAILTLMMEGIATDSQQLPITLKGAELALRFELSCFRNEGHESPLKLWAFRVNPAKGLEFGDLRGGYPHNYRSVFSLKNHSDSVLTGKGSYVSYFPWFLYRLEGPRWLEVYAGGLLTPLQKPLKVGDSAVATMFEDKFKGFFESGVPYRYKAVVDLMHVGEQKMYGNLYRQFGKPGKRVFDVYRAEWEFWVD